ncbi:hypothetical protein [Sorangium sp. So ce854]|uniref:hypothetical protein n=1 Tax=Sorangium sp. So ce854 TaxID=3133322 RepID=UPI003F6181D8
MMTDAGKPQAKLGGRDGAGHVAARAAREAFEETLLGMPGLPLEFDRADLRDRLLRGVQYLHTVLDMPVTALAHLTGLNEAAAVASECRTLLARAGSAELPDLARALSRLDAAASMLRRAFEEVAAFQLRQRDKLTTGERDGGATATRPFRASVGVPALHAFARRPLLPHVLVDPAKPLVGPQPSAPVLPRPTSLAELRALAAEAASGELARRVMGQPREAAPVPAPPAPPLYAFEPAIEEVELLRQLARDCLEDIANGRNLRKPNAIESWLDQEPFEQRILDNIDAFVALGGVALPMASLFHAEAQNADPERAFAAALTLGCVEGSDTVAAAVMTLKQSAPEERDGWIEGFWLAPSPEIDRAMADLCASSRADFAALALDVLARRAATPDEVVRSLLHRAEPAIRLRVAQALASSLPRAEAVEALLEMVVPDAPDDVFVAAMESLLRRGHGDAIALLRRTAEDALAPERARRSLELLCLVGRASDLDRLVAVASASPSATLVRRLGRFGHVGSLGALLGLLEHEDAEVVAAAAEALDRITGAGLRELVEEPWDVELPPEAVDTGGIPVPTRKVERIVTDPEQWSAWLRKRAPRLDAKLKIRGGTAFTPLQIVDELESRTSPPDAREEAALELALVTGLRSEFSPHDWVARQRQHLSDLRARVAALEVTPGAWSHGLVREPVRAALPFRPAKPGIEELRAPHGSEQTPTSRASVDLGATVTGPLAPAAPILPFHATAPARNDTAGNAELSPSARLNHTVSIPRIPAAPALPFRPVQPPPGQDFRNTAPASGHLLDASTSSTGTQDVPLVPTSPVTPFRPFTDGAAPTPLLSSPAVGPLRGSGTPSTSTPLPLIPLTGQPDPPGSENALSSARHESRCAELASSGGATSSAPPAEMLKYIHGISLAQYAEICATVTALPDQVVQIRDHYKMDAHAWTTLHAVWQERFQRDPTLRPRWQALVESALSRRKR